MDLVSLVWLACPVAESTVRPEHFRWTHSSRWHIATVIMLPTGNSTGLIFWRIVDRLTLANGLTGAASS